MKSRPLTLCAIALLLAVPATTGAPEPPALLPDAPRWNVRVEVLMIALPQERLLPLLPALRDPDRIEAVVVELLGSVQRKEAVLMGYPTVTTLDRNRANAETVMEKRYPVEFELPKRQAPGMSLGTDAANADRALATAFETRNLGPMLEVEAHVSPRGESIQLELVAQRVDLQGFESFDAVLADGRTIKVGQPQFFTTKTQTMLSVANGRRVLLAVHLLPKPEHQAEVFILQASATPVK